MADQTNNIESIVAEAVKAKVGTMVVDALGDPGALVRQIVSEALTMSVKDRGYPYKTEPVIHRMVRKAIVEEAQSVMVEWIAEQRPAIHKELAKRINADRNLIAETLIDSLTKVAGNQYRMSVIFSEKSE